MLKIIDYDGHGDDGKALCAYKKNVLVRFHTYSSVQSTAVVVLEIPPSK